MKQILSIFLLFLAINVVAQSKQKDKDLETEAAKITKELSLNSKSEHLVYNVLYHVKTRISDIPLGRNNYEKLLSYVDDERVSMMKSLMTTKQYKDYERLFGETEKQKMKNLVARNAEYIRVNGVLQEKATSADLVNNSFLGIDNSENEEDIDNLEKSE